MLFFEMQAKVRIFFVVISSLILIYQIPLSLDSCERMKTDLQRLTEGFDIVLRVLDAEGDPYGAVRVLL